jgi:hypothetical protein
MHIPLGTIQLRDGVEFTFPNHLCCNCATQKDLRLIEQKTVRTSYMVLGGTETTFRLPLPFCSRCAATAKRHPKSAFHRILQFGLAAAVWFAVLIVLGELGYLPNSLASHLFPLAASLGIATIAAIAMVSRPSAGQSSYFQPVRIPELKQEFVSGAVKAIGFSFANPTYAKAFCQANQEAIARKQLFVSKF